MAGCMRYCSRSRDTAQPPCTCVLDILIQWQADTAACAWCFARQAFNIQRRWPAHEAYLLQPFKEASSEAGLLCRARDDRGWQLLWIAHQDDSPFRQQHLQRDVHSRLHCLCCLPHNISVFCHWLHCLAKLSLAP